MSLEKVLEEIQILTDYQLSFAKLYTFLSTYAQMFADILCFRFHLTQNIDCILIYTHNL